MWRNWNSAEESHRRKGSLSAAVSGETEKGIIG
jgi:hypothetical protein